MIGRQMAKIWTFLCAAAFAAALLVPSDSALAQNAPTANDARAQIETFRLELQQIEAALQRDTLDDRRLGELKQRLEPLATGLSDLVQREQPLGDDLKARLEQLGAAPDVSKGQSESVEVARDRAELLRLWKESDETLRRVKALSLRADQVAESIADRRRQNFSREILAQHPSLASPWLWLDVLRLLPSDVRALNFLLGQWGETILNNLDWYEAIILALVALAIVLAIPRARSWVESGQFFASEMADDSVELTRLQKIMIALRQLAFSTFVPAAALFLINSLLQRFHLLPGRAEAVMEAFLMGLVLLAFLYGLARAVLSPVRPHWRIVVISSQQARALASMIVGIAILVVIGKTIDSLLAATVASLPLTLATRGIIAVLVALMLARGLRHAYGQSPMGTSSASPDIDQRDASNAFSLRAAGWSTALVLIGAVLLGYVPLANFLVTQLVWLIVLGLVCILLLALIEEVIAAGLAGDGFLGRRIRLATGVTAASLDQLSVLGSGALRLVVFVAVTLLALAPWGVDSSSFLTNIRAAFFGFQVGGVTISLATIALAIVFFAIGYFITRAIQNWLDKHYLPRTTLDPGLQNSIRTVLGYIGILIATMIALSQLGFSLDKLTIVAGALSVGIGFGLQSIVSNFVSGLILLWERPIRVGDWIVVGDEQGTVKRINVRSTEIVTFDRASLIIPNSEFISGRVKNWVHSDRTARIIIPICVDYGSDPEQVEQILLATANAQMEVMSEPKPIVIFKALGNDGLEFELRCFTDVDAMLMLRSTLLFDIFRRLKEAQVVIASPSRKLEITNLPPMIDPRRVARDISEERDG
ncbi:COG3264 Small-conductance mechanosensitive channel [Rhabdaerophilaceae bacterium]